MTPEETLMTDTTTPADDPRVSELTSVTVVRGDASPGAAPARCLRVRTADLPELDALLDELSR